LIQACPTNHRAPPITARGCRRDRRWEPIRSRMAKRRCAGDEIPVASVAARWPSAGSDSPLPMSPTQILPVCAELTQTAGRTATTIGQ